MAEVPVAQILHKERYFTQAMLPLPGEVPYPPLAPSSLRLRTRALTLSTNNFVYCRLGFLLGWWDCHPLPASTPAPYDDAAVYGRISAWGYLEVLESTLPSVPAGALLFGYLPIATLAQDVRFEPGATPGQLRATSPHRQGLLPLYNVYTLAAPGKKAQLASRAPEAGLDVVLRIMAETAHLLNAYVFAPSPADTIPPATTPPVVWSEQRADLTGATLVFLAPGSKVALALAHLVRRARPASGARPARVIGAASDASRAFVEGTAKYDAVVSTAESPADFLPQLGVKGGDKVVLVDFGGRGGVGARWTSLLADAYKGNFLLLTVGSEIVEQSQDTVKAALAGPKPDFVVAVNASNMREDAIRKAGEAEYLAGLERDLDSIYSDGINGFSVTWGEGMDAVAEGWDRLARGDVTPDEGLVYLV